MKSEEYHTAYMKILCAFVSLCSMIIMGACSTEGDDDQLTKVGSLKLTTSVNGFEMADGSGVTRTNLAGNAFAVGDRIKLKIVCPYDTDHTHFAETTYGNTSDNLWLLKWDGSDWAIIDEGDKVDVAAQYKYTEAYNLFGRYEAQQTPYVYTASTWNENVLFIADHPSKDEPFLYSQYSYIFQANQSKQENYLKCDLLWAQTYMQTGSFDVHLSFNHVMACLEITLDDSALPTEKKLSANAIVTLEGMPDIDQCEVVVGDYYADRAKGMSHGGYSYQQKCRCSTDNNGKVLGVAINTESVKKAIVYPINGTAPVTNTSVYTAYNAGSKTYYLIVPPCELATKAVFLIRDGEKRFSYELQTKKFEQGKLYPVTIRLNE